VWCGRAVAARLLPQQPPSGRAAAGRTPTGAAPAAAWRRGSNRFEAGQQPSRGLTDAARQPRGSCLARAAPAQLLPRQEAPAKNCKFPGTLSARCRLRRLAANGLLAFSKTAALGVSPCAGTPPLKRSVGTHGAASNPACRTRCPKEPHAQRSWHLQRSLPAQSEDLRT
jgi:hypothetical protein